MDGQQFENELAQNYRKQGFKTTLTDGTSDRGVDILIEKSGVRIAVQAKHYSRGNRVGSPAIQKASGLLTRSDIDRVIVVTTSSFTPEAKKIAKNRGVELDIAERRTKHSNDSRTQSISGRDKRSGSSTFDWADRENGQATSVDCPTCGDTLQRTGWFAFLTHFLECGFPDSKPESIPSEKWAKIQEEAEKRVEGALD